MNVAEFNLSLDQLRELIGVRVEYNGLQCEIVEILEDGPALILQHDDSTAVIQADQHGEAHRKVPPTLTIQIFAADGKGLSAPFLSLDLIDDV